MVTSKNIKNLIYKIANYKTMTHPTDEQTNRLGVWDFKVQTTCNQSARKPNALCPHKQGYPSNTQIV